jgi:hypothetical protein
MDTKCLIVDDDELGKISWRDGTKNTETLFKSKPNNFPFTPVNQPREKIINDIFSKKNISKVSKVLNEINN